MRGKQRNGAPPIDKLTPWLKSAAAFSLVGVIAVILKGLSSPIHHLSTYSKDQMKDVFSSNETWVVACHNTTAAVAEVFSSAANEMGRELPQGTKFGILDCGGTLPSGKTVWKRFDLEPRAETVFVVGPGLRPTQAANHHMESHDRFRKWLKAIVEPHAVPVATTRELDAKCLGKSSCAVILKAGFLGEDVRAAFKGAMQAHRALRFVSIDAAKQELSIEKKLGLSVSEGEHRLLFFKKAEPPAGTKAGTKPPKGTPRWQLAVYEGTLREAEMAKWLRDLQAPGGPGAAVQLWPVTRLPTLLTRKPPKKAASPPPNAGAGSSGSDSGAPSGGASGAGNNPGGYSGLTKEEILERFRKQQQEREGQKRAQMEQEAEGFFFDVDEETAGEGASGSGSGGSGGGDEDDDWGDEEVVDLD